MKDKINQASLILGTSIAFLTGISGVFSQASLAGNPISFECVYDNGLPTTMARNLKTTQTLAIIRWKSSYFANSGYSPADRCRIVSYRFQQAYDQGRLNYITAGVVNRQKVICATARKGSCNGSNILFTLEPQHSAAETLQQLFDVRYYSAAPLVRGGAKKYPHVDVQGMLSPLIEQESQVEQNSNNTSNSIDSSPLPQLKPKPTPRSNNSSGFF